MPIVNYVPVELFNPSDSFLDLASCCCDMECGPWSNLIFPNGAHKEPILSRMRQEYITGWEIFSACPPNIEIGEHRFNQQTFLLLVAHIEGEF